MNRRFGWMLLVTVGLVANSGCHLLGNRHKCNYCNTGCRPGPIGWQHGGTDYQTYINRNSARFDVHHHQDYRYQNANSGVPTAAIAYPYYTNRGPRDFLINNPPTIGR